MGELFEILLCVGLVALAIWGLDWIDRVFRQIEAEERAANAKPWGDVVEVPDEAKRRAACSTPGEGAEITARRRGVRTRHIAHDKRGTTR